MVTGENEMKTKSTMKTMVKISMKQSVVHGNEDSNCCEHGENEESGRN